MNQEQERRKPQPFKTCWQQKVSAMIIGLLALGGTGTGIINHVHGVDNEESIRRVRTTTDERVQELTVRHAEVKTGIEAIHRDIERVERTQSKMEEKIDRLIERK